MATNSTEIFDAPLSSTKITDVNIDCLEKICNYLKFEDLLSVADVHTHLRKAANLVYGLKYGNKIVYIGSMRKSSPAPKVFFNNHDRMFIYSLKTMLKTFRCFGHNISQIHVQGIIPLKMTETEYKTSFAHLMSYIGEYCTGQLNHLLLEVTTKNVLDHFKKPFLRLQKLTIYADGFTADRLNKLCPNLKHLEIIIGSYFIKSGNCIANDFANIEKYFPYLNQMEIVSNFSLNRYSMQTGELYESVFDIVKLTNVRQFSECWGEKLPFANLEEICLEFHPENDEEFHSFFSKYRSITTLILTQKSYSTHKFNANDLNVSKLANTLPWLKQIDLSCCKFTPNVAVEWMEQFKKLEKFRFYFEFQSDYIDLQARLGSEWQSDCTVDDGKYMCDLICNRLPIN